MRPCKDSYATPLKTIQCYKPHFNQDNCTVWPFNLGQIWGVASPNDLPFFSTDMQNGKAKQNTKLLKSQNKVVYVVKNQKIYRSLFTPVQASMAPMGQECEEHRKHLLEQRWIKKIYSKQVRQLSNERPSEIIRKTKPKALQNILEHSKF